MPPVIQNKTGREYWRSLDDFVDSADFQTYIENEFPTELETVLTPANRRTFLKLMGASMALAGAGLTGCRRWPDEKIAPFAHRPENYTPGESEFFATTMEYGGVGQSVLVRSNDGRPTKVEGNTLSSISQGSSNAAQQGSILEFYDPERSRSPVHRGHEEGGDGSGSHSSSMEEFHQAADQRFSSLRSRRGQGVAILTETSSSASLADMKARVRQAMPQASWFEYEAISRDNEIEGARLAFGNAHRPQCDLSKADVVVSLDCDLLMTHPAAARHARDFAARRTPDGHMNRLYAAEATVSITGANADERLAIRAGEIGTLTTRIAQLLADHGVTVLGAASVALPLREVNHKLEAFAAAVAMDLSSARGNGLVVAGPRQPAEVHALVHAINFALGNVGQTINYTQEPEDTRASHVESISRFVAEAYSFDTIVIIGGNPVYDAPADVDVAAALREHQSTGSSIHLSVFDNETSHACAWHVPMAHWLESWGDARAWDGTVSIRQPLILPLYDGISEVELFGMMVGDGVSSGYDILRRWFRDHRGPQDLESAWRQMLHDGQLAGSAWPFESVTLDPSRWTTRLQQRLGQMAGEDGVEVNLIQDPALYDGRFAGNGWLQELPDPIAKICWDNAALMSPATAEANELRGDDLIYIECGPKSGRTEVITIPVHIIPGHADGSITLNVGYGRTHGGHIGTDVGVNVYPLRQTMHGTHFDPPMDIRGDASISKATGRHALATVQDHHAMDAKTTRDARQKRIPTLIPEASLAAYQDDPKHAMFPHAHHMPIVSLWEDKRFVDGPNRWGMMIDLNKCIGCSSCMIACQAENNIPIVGRDQVMRGREMHWIRVDRYFGFKATEFDQHGTATSWDSSVTERFAFQPIPCQHCETAPCEQVCPVAATTHDRDGLNVMIYNRCIGTRYCSNNCPYKVRRFNFYDWHVEDPRGEGLKPPSLDIPDQAHAKAFDGQAEVKKMSFNPEVTVRPRGVMEKCSYCIQRINKAKIKAKNEWIKQDPQTRRARSSYIPDGMFTTACAEACSTNAIIFGDLDDPNSQVTELRKSDRTYSLLEELNTRPRTKYMGRVRNYSPVLHPKKAEGSTDHGNGEADH